MVNAPEFGGTTLRVAYVLMPNQAFSSSSGAAPRILGSMRSRTSRAIAAVILVTCFVCPLVDMFDNWDHAIQTGNETEYSLFVLALCVGLAYSFARFILTFPVFRSAGNLASNLCACKLLAFTLRGSSFISPIPLSPPTLALRI
jgi:hypothetical protein